MVELLSLETAVPPHVLAKEDTLELLPALSGDPVRAARFRQTVEASRVAERHLVLPARDLVALTNAADKERLYRREALALAEEVGRRALDRSGMAASQIGSVVSVSCTGYLLPSLDAYLLVRWGLDVSARRIPISGLGCSAGVAGLALAADLAAATRSAALLVAVEVCSACIQTRDPSDAEVIGNLLFADAAAATVVRPAGPQPSGPEIVGSATELWPETLDLLGMRLGNTGLGLVLSPDLARVIRDRLPQTIGRFLARHGIGPDDLAFWIVHPGGPRILETVGETLGLAPRALDASWDVWERHGNVSSTTVFLIAEAMRRTAPPRAGALGVVLAFGPGLSCELVLLRASGWLSDSRR